MRPRDPERAGDPRDAREDQQGHGGVHEHEGHVVVAGGDRLAGADDHDATYVLEELL